MSKPRTIFEEVTESRPDTAAAPEKGAISKGQASAGRGPVRLWLLLLFALVALMVVIGGLTRLADAGLSITEWNLVSGTVPPLNAADWQVVFEKYQASPEYLLQNKGMSLAEFKQIYWWEWAHRFLGRIVGLVWAVGFAGFWLAGRIPRGWHMRLFGIGVLGAMQGVIGWWMVASGLRETMVDVASYRLAIHLGLAFVILGFLGWFILSLGQSEAARMQARRSREAGLMQGASLLLALVFTQILLGALVAGIDAGRSFVDWPWMGGQVFPPDAFSLQPGWRNLFENAGLVQFMHRSLGYVIGLFALFLWLRSRKSAHNASRIAGHYLAAMTLLQMLLGIFTVLYAAPLHLAITHQIGAILLWVLILKLRHQASFPTTQSIRS